MFSCDFLFWAFSPAQRRERGDEYCTTPRLERKLEVFEWVPRCRATEGGTVLARMVNRFQQAPTSPQHHYYKHEATLPDFSTKDLSQYTLTPPSQCEFELVQAVTDHLRHRRKRASDGWKFTCEISSGREQLLPQRDPDAGPQKVVLLEREVPCRCGRGSNCFRVRTSAGRSYSAAIRRQATLLTQADAMSINDRNVKERELRLPQDTARLSGTVVKWADPPGYGHEEGGDLKAVYDL